MAPNLRDNPPHTYGLHSGSFSPVQPFPELPVSTQGSKHSGHHRRQRNGYASSPLPSERVQN